MVIISSSTTAMARLAAPPWRLRGRVVDGAMSVVAQGDAGALDVGLAASIRLHGEREIDVADIGQHGGSCASLVEIGECKRADLVCQHGRVGGRNGEIGVAQAYGSIALARGGGLGLVDCDGTRRGGRNIVNAGEYQLLVLAVVMVVLDSSRISKASRSLARRALSTVTPTSRMAALARRLPSATGVSRRPRMPMTTITSTISSRVKPRSVNRARISSSPWSG